MAAGTSAVALSVAAVAAVVGANCACAMAEMAPAPAIVFRTITLRPAAAADRSIDIALFDGAEPASLANAVAARLGCDANGFFLTAGQSPSSPVVPLSSALPDGMQLTLHYRGAPPPSPAAASINSTVPAASCSLVTPYDEVAGRLGGEQPARRGMLRRLLTSEQKRASEAQSTEAVLDGLQRLTRLNSDLANERTLLAWIRTDLAAIRTLWGYMTIGSAVAFWDDLALVAMMLMTTLVAFTSAYGVYRYYVIKNVLSKPTKDLPADYGRKSTRPLAVLVVLCSVVTAAGMYSQMWEKN